MSHWGRGGQVSLVSLVSRGQRFSRHPQPTQGTQKPPERTIYKTKPPFPAVSLSWQELAPDLTLLKQLTMDIPAPAGEDDDRGKFFFQSHWLEGNGTL